MRIFFSQSDVLLLTAVVYVFQGQPPQRRAVVWLLAARTAPEPVFRYVHCYNKSPALPRLSPGRQPGLLEASTALTLTLFVSRRIDAKLFKNKQKLVIITSLVSFIRHNLNRFFSEKLDFRAHHDLTKSALPHVPYTCSAVDVCGNYLDVSLTFATPGVLAG